MEHNRTAADGSTYDNGYGICLIPVGKLFQEKFSNVNSAKSYASSYIRTYMSKNTSKYLKNNWTPTKCGAIMQAGTKGCNTF